WEWDEEEVKGDDGEVQSSYGLRHQHHGYTPRGPLQVSFSYNCPLHYTIISFFSKPWYNAILCIYNVQSGFCLSVAISTAMAKCKLSWMTPVFYQ
ncbi:hypothetical protein ACJX0J_031379, partial [Zea mays]